MTELTVDNSWIGSPELGLYQASAIIGSGSTIAFQKSRTGA